MTRTLSLLAVIVLMVTGALLVWPQVRGYWTHRRSEGRIIDVLPEQVPGGVRLRLTYEFPAGRTEEGQRRQLGYQVADPFFKPIDDPLLPADRAEGILRRLRDADSGVELRRTVFYQPEDPAGTAFILDDTVELPRRRLHIGFVLIALGVLWSFAAARQRPS